MFLLGLALWVSLLGLGGKWVANPVLRPPRPAVAQITAEETAKTFPFRLASLPNTQSAIGGYARRLESEEATPPAVPFDYDDWAFREVRKRLIAFFIVWTVGGGLAVWLGRRWFHRPEAA